MASKQPFINDEGGHQNITFPASSIELSDGTTAQAAVESLVERLNGTTNIYGVCHTAAATVDKTVNITGFKLETGASVKVKFTSTNTAASPTLNVNNTGAKPIYYRGAVISTGYLAENRTYEFVYNGTQYELVGDVNVDTNNATAQNVSTANATYPVLLGATADATANIGNEAALFGSGVKVNPSTSEVIATKFTGALDGNAATATKLATARTFWGASFDGSGNVSGNMTGVGNLSASGSITGKVLRSLPQDTDDEGGEVALLASKDIYNGINIDNYRGLFRIFGIPSADGTTKSGTGTVLYINPYDKTITGGYTLTGNVTGSSGSCTGNAATATKATQDKNGNDITTTYYPSTGGVLDGYIVAKSNVFVNYQDLVRGDKPETNKYRGIYFHTGDSTDVLTERIAALESAIKTDGSAHLYMQVGNNVKGAYTNASMGIHSDPDGNYWTSAPTPAAADNSTKIATTAWVRTTTGIINHSAESHNGIYRGKDLTSYFTSGQMSTDIANGKFDDIYIGDYITKTVNLPAITYTDKAGTEKTQAAVTYSNVKWYVAGIDSHLKAGDTQTTAHHVVLISANALQRNVCMNPTNDTTGGYLGSDMWRVHIPNWVTAIKAAFGETHVLQHREWLSNAINATASSGAGSGWTGASSAWAWTDVEVNIPNEQMIYGGRAFGSGHDCGDFPVQLPLFAMKQYIGGDDRSWYWLRAVASASNFAGAAGNGSATAAHASLAHSYGGVRPYFLLR